MILKYEIRDDEHGVGKVLILKQPWTPRFDKLMRKKRIHALRLSGSMGYRGDDISFLSSLQYLRSVEVYVWGVKDLTPIEPLSQLEVLGLEADSRGTLDCSLLTSLRYVLVTWKKGMEGLLTIPSVQYLNVVNYPYEDLAPAASLVDLERLHLTSRKLRSLSGIENLIRLKELDLYNCPFLESLSGVEQCPEKVAIDVETCRHISRKPMRTHNKAIEATS